MADVEIRNVPDWVVEAYRVRAQRGGHSLEEELLGFLTEGALLGRKLFARQAKAFRDTLRRKYGELPDSTPGIREDREARG
jgi:plasmid stability protein